MTRNKSFSKKLFTRKFIFSFLLVLLALLFFLVSRTKFASTDNLLAQAISVETELLKKWQKSGAIRHNLSLNSRGSEVALLQRMLSQDSSIYPQGKITGYYGSLTGQAVYNFQKKHELENSGVVDSPTRKKLNDIFLSHLCPWDESSYSDLILRRVTKDFLLPLNYVPPRLEDITTKVRTDGVTCLRSDVIPFLINMFSDAEKDGVEFMVTSGFRQAEIQKYIYDNWIKINGKSVFDAIAPPGASEHQLGTVVDLTDRSVGFVGADSSFAKGKGMKWLEENAYKYGFSMSFQKNKEKVTGVKYEPWHWRYLGVETATLLYEKNLEFNELNFDADNIAL